MDKKQKQENNLQSKTHENNVNNKSNDKNKVHKDKSENKRSEKEKKEIFEQKYGTIEDFNYLIEQRLNKREKLKNSELNPYPYEFDKNIKNSEVKEKYANIEDGTESEESVKVAGRILTIRNMGKITFLTIKDDTDKLQIFLRKDLLGEEQYAHLKDFDTGDFIGVQGPVFKTRTKEITVNTKEFVLLTKTIRPLPEKYHGIQDKELRYRKRYLDLIMNPEVVEVFKKRSKIISALREFMDKKGFIEVETPLLQTLYGGATARPFITHINAWDMKMFLSISPELYLKRLLVGGFEKVYTICKNFRNEGVDKSHNPEFTMIEAYQAYVNYEDMMKLIEEAWEYCCLKVNGTTKIKHKYVVDNKETEVELDFNAPWKRLSMIDAIKELGGIDISNMPNDDVMNLIHQKNIEYEGRLSWSHSVELLFEELCEDKIIQPTHIIDHPRGSTPLCKKHRKDKRLLERFESACLGMELCNAYSELNDPVVQRRLLEEQSREAVDIDDEKRAVDNDFIEAIETGMPPAGGIGWGVDRMILLLTGAETLRDVILFPTMKPETSDVDNKEK